MYVHVTTLQVLLLDDDEEMDSLLLMPTQDILLRWVNYHLVKADDYRARRLVDWAVDLTDCECYALLLKQLVASSSIPMDPTLLEFGYTCRLSTAEKALAVLSAAEQLGVVPILTHENILSGNVSLNVIFVGQLFSAVSGLSLNQHVREVRTHTNTHHTASVTVQYEFFITRPGNIN
jgi:plastin-1